MKKLIILLVITGLLSGCAGLRMPELASCDGSEKRALNKSQWQWQERADLGGLAKSCG
jgi:uncharacterized protein YceK